MGSRQIWPHIRADARLITCPLPAGPVGQLVLACCAGLTTDPRTLAKHVNSSPHSHMELMHQLHPADGCCCSRLKMKVPAVPLARPMSMSVSR